jgi:hypothetical protein
MMLDINTPRGQQTLKDEDDAVSIFEFFHPAYRYIHTPKREPGDVDGLIIKSSGLTGVVETKCRYDVTLAQFVERYSEEWLVTFDKIIKGMKIAEALRVPFYGFLYIVQSKALLTKRLWTPDGGLDFTRMIVRKTKTQATVNGGTALRDNAFIDMRGVEPLFLDEVVR